MKHARLILISTAILLLVYGCTHDAPLVINPAQKDQRTILERMCGTRIWHGFYNFSPNSLDTLSNKSITITLVNDSQISMSSYALAGAPLTYSGTDSVTHSVMFFYSPGPSEILRYYYLGDSLSFRLSIGGIHNEYTELFTP